jgi:hypothetical protein
VLKTDAQKAQLQMKLAEMDEHLGKTDLAEADLRAELLLTKDAAQRKAISTHLATLTGASAQEAKNASRRPAIKDDLQQSVVVRPRLTVAAPARTGP